MSLKVTAYTVAIGSQRSLSIAQGEDREFRLTFTESGTARDMTGAQAITLTVRSRTTGIEIFSRLYSGFQGASTAGTPRFQVLAADTADEGDGPYDCWVEWTDASGYVEQLLVESTFEILTGADPGSVTSPPGVPVVYGLNWYTGYTGSWWTALTGGYAPNDAVIAYDGSLGATAVSSFRAIASGVTYYPINASLVVSSGWQYVGQHGGAGAGAGGGSSGPVSMPFDITSDTPSGYWRWESGGSGRVWTPGGDFFRVVPGTTGGLSWGMGLASSENVDNANRNTIVSAGLNKSSQGRIDATKQSFADIYEGEYGASGGALSEYYKEFIGPSGMAYTSRIFTVNAAIGSTSIDVGLVGTRVALGIGFSINEADRLVIGATSTSIRSAAPSFVSTISLGATGIDLSAGSGSTLASVGLYNTGDIRLRSLLGSLGRDGENPRFQWTASGARHQGPAAGNYFQANDTDLQIVANGTTGVAFNGSNLVLNASEEVYVRKAGVRAFRFGETGNRHKLFGIDDNAWLSLANGANVGIFDGASGQAALTVAASQGIQFRFNSTGIAQVNNLGFYPDRDAAYDLGIDGQRWNKGRIVQVIPSYLSTDDLAANYFLPAGSGNDTLVALALAQTLTNKTLTAPNFSDSAAPSSPAAGLAIYSTGGNLWAKSASGTVRMFTLV